ncbi:MAG: PD-(D/E)XK nuclease domain-containing protein [Chitinispirillales bacterium]|jgi:ASC-1-like (ASCH) protein|nr:PD-(D/E)XK nuclease domain-containing protein [Chitinispirillales bacterium]
MLPPADRLVGAQLDRYIRDQLYWVLHAPRQTGKTTFLQDWARKINAGGEAVACYVSLEACQGITDRAEAIRTISASICSSASISKLPIPKLPRDETEVLIKDTMQKWAEMVSPKPLIVFFDEADVLVGEPLISFLRQLRKGFADRGPGKFPISLALVGLRDLRDYITAAKDGVSPNPGSPFNIKSDSVFIPNFTKQDIAALFAQRTEETGQKITTEALEYVYELSWGQPWMVNSLFQRATMRVLREDDYQTVTYDHIHTARQQMVAARETHLDSLLERLREPKIRNVVESIMIGNIDPNITRYNRDIEFAIDIGLIKWNTETGFTIANPIYTEMFTRLLNSGYHDNMPPPSIWKWQKPDGKLDMDSLLKEFQRFWRRFSEIWEQKTDYTEAFPHLLLTAFLQRLTNSHGRIEHESAAGRGRMDIFVEYEGDKFIIEIKLLRSYDTPKEVLEEGLEQIAAYRDKAAPGAPAYLMIFDRRDEAKQKSWDERISWETEGEITVVRC